MTDEVLSDKPVAPVETDRLSQLRSYYMEIADNDGHLSPETWDYLKAGGSLRDCLAEIEREGQTEANSQLAKARQAYLTQAMSRSSILSLIGVGRAARKKESDRLREAYVRAVIGQIDTVIEARTPEQALASRQLPYRIGDTAFSDDHTPTLTEFAGKHLHITTDIALREHNARRQLIANRNHNSHLRRFINNRELRMSLAGLVFLASAYPDLHFIKIDNPGVADGVQHGLEIASASIFVYETPDEIRWRYLDIVHGRSTKKMREQLASDKQLSDLSLRMAYSNSHYRDKRISAGSDDKRENLRRFSELDNDFIDFNNEPGGKPYNGNQALGYAARLLIQKRDKVDRILADGQTAEQRKADYLKLSRDILEEDLTRMEKGLSASRVRQIFWRIAGAIPTALFPGAVVATSDAIGLGHDVATVGTDEDQQS